MRFVPRRSSVRLHRTGLAAELPTSEIPTVRFSGCRFLAAISERATFLGFRAHIFSSNCGSNFRRGPCIPPVSDGPVMCVCGPPRNSVSGGGFRPEVERTAQSGNWCKIGVCATGDSGFRIPALHVERFPECGANFRDTVSESLPPAQPGN